MPEASYWNLVFSANYTFPISKQAYSVAPLCLYPFRRGGHSTKLLYFSAKYILPIRLLCRKWGQNRSFHSIFRLTIMLSR